MERIRIPAGCPYDVLVGEGILAQAGELLRPLCAGRQAVICYDPQVADRVSTLAGEVKKAGMAPRMWEVPQGEIHKNLDTVARLLSFLAEEGIHRSDLLIAVGGGMTGDTVGFAAAVYQRGMDYIQIPTTLLAMVDASVGGKTAVNLPQGKNLTGAFHQPRLVLCDTSLPELLPEPLLRQGMAEVLKCGFLQGGVLLKRIETGAVADWMAVVSDCVRYKADMVAQDEYDRNGVRVLLNAGHTVGHAIEACDDYRISHGEAVAMGLLQEARLAVRLGICAGTTAERIENVLACWKLPVEIPYDREALLRAMERDKKNRDERIVLALPERIGCYRETAVTVHQLNAVWNG